MPNIFQLVFLSCFFYEFNLATGIDRIFSYGQYQKLFKLILVFDRLRTLIYRIYEKNSLKRRVKYGLFQLLTMFAVEKKFYFFLLLFWLKLVCSIKLEKEWLWPKGIKPR